MLHAVLSNTAARRPFASHLTNHPRWIRHEGPLHMDAPVLANQPYIRCQRKDLSKAIDDRNRWGERINRIYVIDITWWWWWWWYMYKYIYIYISTHTWTWVPTQTHKHTTHRMHFCRKKKKRKKEKERNNTSKDENLSWTINLYWKFSDTNPRIKKRYNLIKTATVTYIKENTIINQYYFLKTE